MDMRNDIRFMNISMWATARAAVENRLDADSKNRLWLYKPHRNFLGL
jgi:hypothetical protein